MLRGTAQNPDAFFQAREACNLFYDACPAIVQQAMDRFGRADRHATYKLFDYVGASGGRARHRASWARAPRRRTRPWNI